MGEARKEVMSVPAEMLTRDGRDARSARPAAAAAEEERLREWARLHVERVHRLKLHVAAFVLGMVVLAPVWVFVEWESNGAFERLSDGGKPGDWDPWILYVALVWGTIVAFAALRTSFDRPTTEAEIDHELRRLREPR